MKSAEKVELVRVRVPVMGLGVRVEHGADIMMPIVCFQDERKVVNERYMEWLMGLVEEEKVRRGMGRFWVPGAPVMWGRV